MHENAALIERGYELFGKGDLDGLRSLFTDDVVWHTAGLSVFAAEYKGIEDLFGYFAKLFELTGGTLKTEPLHIVADDDRALAIQRMSGTREGKLLETTMVLDFEIRGDRVYSVTEFAAEFVKLDAFW